MSGLASKIAGDWFDIREAFGDIDRLQDILLPDPVFARQQQRNLLLSVEEGTVEYKRGVTLNTFAVLEDANFRTFQSQDYRGVELHLQFLTFIAAVQRNLAVGTLSVRGHDTVRSSEKPDRPAPDIREIMSDIQSRIRSDGASRRLPQIKNILMQINKYSREVDALKKLVGTAPDDKKPAYVRNFRANANEIFDKIKRQYADLVREEREKIEQPPDNPLIAHDLKPLAPVFAAQAEGFASVASTIVYARREADRVREAVVAASRRQNAVLSLVEAERQAYQTLDPTGADSLARAFARELVAVLDEHI